MPESKTTPAPEGKKNDAPVTATPKFSEQKQPAPAQAGAAAATPKQPENKSNVPPKEPPKVPPAPPTTPPPPPKAAPPTQTENKGKANPEKKPEPPKQAAPEVKKPDDKDGKNKAAEESKKEQPGKSDAPKPAPPAEPTKKESAEEPKKTGEKKVPKETAKGPVATDPEKSEAAPPAADPKGKAPTDSKKPEVKTPAADTKGKPANAPKGDEAKDPIKVDGKGKVEIPIEPKGKEEDSKGAPAADPKKKETATEPPKGVKITKVYADRLDKPTQADLEKLPIPKEGEGFSMRLHPAYFFEFLNHPFSVNRETDDYKELYDSIKENGINEPIKARPREGGGLELISGHRRHDVAMQLNYPVPVVIVQADNDSAQIEVVDGNLHRKDIPTSELALAAKMKIEAMSRKVGRRSKMEQLASPQKRTDQIVAEEMGYSRTQLTRLVRIDSLVPEMKKMLYTQAFQELYYQADKVHGGGLPVPVRLMFDEFANVALPDGYARLQATMRSRNIMATIILQNISQLKALFKDDWEGIIGNADAFVYLGGNEQSTHKYVSELLGKETIDTRTSSQSKGHNGSYSQNFQQTGRELMTPDEVRMLDNKNAIVLIRGEPPVIDQKYDLMKHPNIKLTHSGGAFPYVHSPVCLFSADDLDFTFSSLDELEIIDESMEADTDNSDAASPG